MVVLMVEHWKCSCCGRRITDVNEDGDVTHVLHFDVSRSNKVLEVEDDSIEEDESLRNEKMLEWLCEECFVKVLNESPTLGKLFFNSEKKMFIY
jgi:hypothetical protein